MENKCDKIGCVLGIDIDECRLRATSLEMQDIGKHKYLRISAPALAGSGALSLGYLISMLRAQWPHSVSLESSSFNSTPMIVYRGRLACIDILATAGNRLDLDLTFALDGNKADERPKDRASDGDSFKSLLDSVHIDSVHIARVLSWDSMVVEPVFEPDNDERIYSVGIRLSSIGSGQLSATGFYTRIWLPSYFDGVANVARVSPPIDLDGSGLMVGTREGKATRWLYTGTTPPPC